MAAVVVRVEELDVNAALRRLGIDRALVIRVIRACTDGFADCTDNDPSTAKGYEVWRKGTRHFRDELLPDNPDWQKDDALPSIRNSTLHVRLIVLNTDANTGNPDPEIVPMNRLERGVFHERAIKGEWIPGLPNPFIEGKDEVWYLCIYINGDVVQAELSCPARFVDGFIRAWKERIIIVKPGDWREILEADRPDDSGPDIEFDVRLR